MTVTAIRCIYCGNPTGHTQNTTSTRVPNRNHEICENCQPVHDLEMGEGTARFRNQLRRDMDAAEGVAAQALRLDEDELAERPMPRPHGDPPPLPQTRFTDCPECGREQAWRAEGTSVIEVYMDDPYELVGLENIDGVTNVRLTCRGCGWVAPTHYYEWV